MLDTKETLKSYTLAALTGGMLAAAFPPYSLWMLAWAALVPLLVAVRRAVGVREAANLGAVAGLVFYGFTMRWLVLVFGWAAAAFWCVFALQLALFCAILKKLERRLPAGEAGALLWTAAAAVVWVGIEYFRSEVWWLECSWLALGYSQSASPAAMQSASVWGVYGLSGLIVAASASLAVFGRGRRIPAELMAGVVAMVLFLGERRVEEHPVERGDALRVALVQSERFDLDAMAEMSASVPDAELVVWPEYGFAVRPDQRERYRELIAKRMKGTRAVTVVGAAEFPEKKGDPMRNYAWVLNSRGYELGRYDKAHPIPFVERSLPANPDPRPVYTPYGPIGIQICYDLDFEDGARLMARSGARALVVPNLDPREWGAAQHALHSGMAPLRAVESGLWIARSASSGESQIIDPTGRVRRSLGFAREGVLTGMMRLREGGTLYTAGGWILAPACSAAVAGLLLWLAGIRYPVRRWRSRKIPSRSRARSYVF
jgi:apolipoprotein N-acyltransferase